MNLKFGQPDNSVIQLAYVVADIEASIHHYHQRMAVGPWQLRGPFTTTSALYHGKPVALSLSIAHAFAGHTMIELIQQHDELPSVYTDPIKTTGYGFHHWGVSCPDFDAKSCRCTMRAKPRCSRTNPRSERGSPMSISGTAWVALSNTSK